MIAAIRILLTAFAALVIAAPAQAHPHVWVTMKCELIYAPDGSITGIRHAWSFDDMFSTFATQGMESKEKGKFTREELAPLAKVNVESLKEYDYFTYATADGNKAELAEPTSDYWLDYKDQVLTLQFHVAVQDAGEGQRAETSRSTIRPFSSISRWPRTTRYKLVGAPQCKGDVVACRAK